LPTRGVEFMLRTVLPIDASTTQLMPAPDGVLRVRDEAEFLNALRLRVDELEITYDTLDAIAGLPARFSSKLMARTRHVSPMVLWLLLGAVGYDLALIHNADALARVKTRLVKRKYVPSKHTTLISVARRRMSPWLFTPERGRDAARVRLAKVKPERRSEIAKNAAQTRWKEKCRKC
jgi:hypothetical protein